MHEKNKLPRLEENVVDEVMREVEKERLEKQSKESGEQTMSNSPTAGSGGSGNTP